MKEVFHIGNHEVVIDPTLLRFNEQTLSNYIEQEGAWYDNIGHSLALAERHLGLLEAKHEKFFSERFAEFKDMGGSDKLCESRAKADADVSNLKEQIADAKYRVSRLKQHLKAWDKNHDNAMSMGHMQRKQMDKLNASIMGQVAGISLNDMLSERAIEAFADDEETSKKPEGMQEGTSLGDLW
jgi:hypothetical protein